MARLELLWDAEEIDRRVRRVGERIAADYAGRELVLLAILEGAAMLQSDLARAIDLPMELGFVDVAFREGGRGEIEIVYQTHQPLAGRDVLVLKDVVHSGVTESYLLTHLAQGEPASLGVVALVDKPKQRSVDLESRYAVFDDAPDGHLAGYGLKGPDGRGAGLPALSIVDS